MRSEYEIKDIFRISDGITVIACKGKFNISDFHNTIVKIEKNNKIIQYIRILGIREMAMQSKKMDHFAVDTVDKLLMTEIDAKTGEWKMVI